MRLTLREQQGAPLGNGLRLRRGGKPSTRPTWNNDRPATPRAAQRVLVAGRTDATEPDQCVHGPHHAGPRGLDAGQRTAGLLVIGGWVVTGRIPS